MPILEREVIGGLQYSVVNDGEQNLLDGDDATKEMNNPRTCITFTIAYLDLYNLYFTYHTTLHIANNLNIYDKCIKTCSK